jgi:hypothetical protein
MLLPTALPSASSGWPTASARVDRQFRQRGGHPEQQQPGSERAGPETLGQAGHGLDDGVPAQRQQQQAEQEPGNGNGDHRALPSGRGAILRLARARLGRGSRISHSLPHNRPAGLSDAPGTDPAIGTEREVDHRPALLRRAHAQVLGLLVVLVGADVRALGYSTCSSPRVMPTLPPPGAVMAALRTS